MIIPCNDENIETVFEYIGEDYGKCLPILLPYPPPLPPLSIFLP